MGSIVNGAVAMPQAARSALFRGAPLAFALFAALVLAGVATWYPIDAPVQTRDVPAVYQSGAGFTSDAATANHLGTHEISLSGNVSAANPFDVEVTVKFVPPSGNAGAKTVNAFYDGGSTWKARVYVSEVGAWTWTSACLTETSLDGRSGSFEAVASSLPGLLRKNPHNPRSWETADGRSFVHVSDTAYKLLHGTDSPLWQEYVRDDAAQGITAIRAGSLGAFDDPWTTHDNWTRDPWPGGSNPDYTRFDLAKFQATDERLAWILNNYPRMQIQMILFGLKGYGVDNTGAFWFAIPEVDRQRTMRYMIARWGAFPNLFWLVVNDMHSDPDFPQNRAFAREVGRFFAANEPWPHLMSSGPNRYAGCPFAGPEDRDWCTYAHLEDLDAVGADVMAAHGLTAVPMHIFLAEDRYEQDYETYVDPNYFFRWLFWSWTLSGGSANYGGRWGVTHPYSQTGSPDLPWTGLNGTNFTGVKLHGLDAGPFVASFFESHAVDLARLVPSDELVADSDGRGGQLRPKAARIGDRAIVVYHPNAVATGLAAVPSSALNASFLLDLSAYPRTVMSVEWYRPSDGSSAAGDPVTGGNKVTLTAPWKGVDAVAYLAVLPRAQVRNVQGNRGPRSKGW